MAWLSGLRGGSWVQRWLSPISFSYTAYSGEKLSWRAKDTEAVLCKIKSEALQAASARLIFCRKVCRNAACWHSCGRGDGFRDRKSTRLNSSHLVISYAVFCLKKKK